MGNTKTQNRKQQKACLEFCASVPKPQILAQTQSTLPESHILDHIRWIDGAICSTYGEAVSFLEAQALPSRCMAVAVRFPKESSSIEDPMNPDGRGSSKYSQLSKKLQNVITSPGPTAYLATLTVDYVQCPGCGSKLAREKMLAKYHASADTCPVCGTDLRPFAVRNMQEVQARQLNALYDELYSTPAPKSLYWLVMIPDA